MIVCDFEEEIDSEENPIRCNREATRTMYECIHPPCPTCNQYNCEDGRYLGPEPQPEPDESNNDINYYYCYPTCEDEYHISLNYCEKHWRTPTRTKWEWHEMYMKVKKEKDEIINNV